MMQVRGRARVCRLRCCRGGRCCRAAAAQGQLLLQGRQLGCCCCQVLAQRAGIRPRLAAACLACAHYLLLLCAGRENKPVGSAMFDGWSWVCSQGHCSTSN